MSRLQLLLQRWRLELELLRRRVRDNRVGDAWRFQPLIKVFVFLLKCYGNAEDGGQDRPTWAGRILRVALALVVVLAIVAGYLYSAGDGDMWDRVRERLGDWTAAAPAQFVLFNAIAFSRPTWLFGLLAAPLVFWLGDQWSSDLTRRRRQVARACLTAAAVLVALGAAGPRLVLLSNDLSVIFLVDQSASVPPQTRDQILSAVDATVRQQRQGGDRVGLIAFGGNALVEMLPTERPVPLARSPEGELDRQQTNLADAIDRAASSFPRTSARRIVVISDGNQNRGDVVEAAQKAADAGVGIDVMPIEYRHERETFIEDLSVDGPVRPGQPADCAVVLKAAAATGGTLRLIQRAQRFSGLAAERHVELTPGTNRVVVPQVFALPGFYSLEAVFAPDEPDQDQVAGNNRFQTVVSVAGTPRVLLIEGDRREHDSLVAALEREGIEVLRLEPEQMPSTLAELAAFDCIILANGPATAAVNRREGEPANVPRLTPAQMERLRVAVQDLGTGLVVIGGPNAFGAGGFAGTPIEDAVPVTMPDDHRGGNALVIIMDKLNIAQGHFWEKVVLKDAIKSLSYNDSAGCLVGPIHWLFKVQRVRDKTVLMADVDRMGSPNIRSLDSALTEAWNALRTLDAKIKHVIVATDGNASEPSREVLQNLAKDKITVSTISVGIDGVNRVTPQRMLANIAKVTGGRFYNITDNKALPKVFQREARLTVRPPIFEKDVTWNIKLNLSSDLLDGFAESDFPPISGLLVSSPKEHESVQLPLVSPIPSESPPVLAHWTYGLGRSIAFTSDAGQKWAAAWKDWEGYSKFWAQVVRWSLRTAGDGNFTIASHRDGHQLKVQVVAMDQAGEFSKLDDLQAHVETPRLGRRPLELVESAPGQYHAEIGDATEPGDYFIVLSARLPGADRRFVRFAHATVPYSAEYLELVSNSALLAKLADLTPVGGLPGKFATLTDRSDPTTDLIGADFFRHDLARPQPQLPVGHWLVLASACLVVVFLSCQTREPPPRRREDSQYEATLRNEEVGCP